MNELINGLSMAEKFLGCWSIVATLCAIYYQTRYKRSESLCMDVSSLLCDVACGDTKPVKDGDAYKLEGENGLVFHFKKNPRFNAGKTE